MSKNSVESAVNKFNADVLKLQLTPLDSALSLPIPMIANGNIYLALLCFIGKRLDQDGRIQIYRPNSCFVIAQSTAKIVYYINYTFKDQFKQHNWGTPIGDFPHPEIETLKIKEFREKRNELLISYDQIIEMYITKNIVVSQKISFKDQFYLLCEPCLLPYIKKIGNAFYSWLDDYEVAPV